MHEIRPVILCGGSGTRLWPLSRSGFPKQFLCFTGQESLFQQAVTRLNDIGTPELSMLPPLVVTNEAHRFLAFEQLREAGFRESSALLEPSGRNTAPALTLAALAACEEGQDPVLVVMPADHAVTDTDAFIASMREAIRHAVLGKIIIFGVLPTRPETGYGYIEVGTQQEARNGVFSVRRFVEKPDAATAERYLSHGGYYWNAGIFVLRASVWLQALAHFRPDILQACERAWAARTSDMETTHRFIRPGQNEFAAVPAESIDYSVMEHCPGSSFSLGMVPLDAGWSDLGAWDAVWDVLPKDDAGNAQVGDVVSYNTRNTMVHASSRLVSLVGVNNLVVIETPDAVLVADRSHSQAVKQVVDLLSQGGREEHQLHRKVHRPWGWYDSIDEGGRFKVKRIQVQHQASLSLQKHHHRAEHWIVVKGTAEVTCGEVVTLLSENQSTYIPLGQVHRLRNPGKIPLELIEVQSGSYLGEDDIVRLEDSYGRSP